MPCFDTLFYDAETDTHKSSISYKDSCVIRMDRIDIPKKCRLIIRVVTTNSEWQQGIALNISGKFFVGTTPLGRKIAIWEDTAPPESIVDIESKDGILGVYNLWDTGNGVTDAWHNGAAMIVEDIPNGRRYYCNDGHPDDNFDDLVFEVEILEPQK